MTEKTVKMRSDKKLFFKFNNKEQTRLDKFKFFIEKYPDLLSDDLSTLSLSKLGECVSVLEKMKEKELDNPYVSKYKDIQDDYEFLFRD